MKILFSLVAALLIPSVAIGQAPSPDSIPKVLQKVDSGAALRIRTQRQTSRGTLTAFSDNALVLGVSSGAQTPIRFDAIDEIWREGNYAKPGAIIGGSVGAAVLTGFGLLLVSGLCDTGDGCKSDYPKVVIYGIGIGGGAGALVGGGIGYLTKRWIKVY
jgi:hypothetical protein